jgi:phage/plasmid-like protein (TIGR03299 family)
MAHEITKNAITGAFEFAYRADHGTPWHTHETGAARAMPADKLTDTDAWAEHASMTWQANRSRVRFGEGAAQRTWDAQHVLFRSDTKEPLGICTPSYKPVQPREALECFRGLTGAGGLEISACGTLFGGREFWATARFGEGCVGSRSDLITGFVLMHTSLDGSHATTMRRVAERAVCKNTIRMAFEERGRQVFKVSHRTEFDPAAAREYLGLNLDAWNRTRAAMLRLANTPVQGDEAEDFTLRLLAKVDTPEPAAADKVRESAAFKRILSLFGGLGMGATLDSSAGTRWGLLNAVTEYADHHVRAATVANRWASAQFGAGSDLKDRAAQLLGV